MGTVLRTAVLGGALMLGASVAAPAHAADIRPPALTVIGGESTNAVAINSRGQVAVAARADGQSFIWDKGRITNLPSRFVPVAINDKGHVAGNVEVGDAPYSRAAIWRDGALTMLGPDQQRLSALALNDRDEVVGYGEFDDARMDHAFVWRSGTLTELDTPATYETVATAINNNGDIVGSMRAEIAGERHAIRWRDGQRSSLGDGITWASGINERGEISVDTFLSGRDGIGVWRDGVLRPIATTAAPRSAGINEHGDIAGTIIHTWYDREAIRSSHGSERRFGPGQGSAINDAGTVAGRYEPKESYSYAAIWK
jgi:probable HAF family extracellular repeat protein